MPSFEREFRICPKIPKHDNACGDEFGGVKIETHFFNQQKNEAIIEGQTDERGEEKFAKLFDPIWLDGGKRPDSIEPKIPKIGRASCRERV